MLPSVPVASTAQSLPAIGVPACPSLAGKRLQKEWDDIMVRGGISRIPWCVSVERRKEDPFFWLAFFAKRSSSDTKGKRREDTENCLVIELSFPRNYPFSPPHVTCTDFALFVPGFIPDWTPRMTVQKLLATVISKLEKLSFPINHVALGMHHPDEVTFNSIGLRATNETSSKVILLSAKPLDKRDRFFWSVEVNKGGEIDVGVSTLWEGHNLMQYIWSYLEVGVIQQILLPEGSKNTGRKEKLNSYEYAAEEVGSFQAEPFGTGDTINIFYDGVHESLSFFKNGVFQYTFTSIWSIGPTSGSGVEQTGRPTVSRRGRRARAAESELQRTNEGSPNVQVARISHSGAPPVDVAVETLTEIKSNCSSPVARPSRHTGQTSVASSIDGPIIHGRGLSSRGSSQTSDPLDVDESTASETSSVGHSLNGTEPRGSHSRKKITITEPPNGLLFPAVSLNAKADVVTFTFEPPPWNNETHRYYPRYFTPIVRTLLYALEKKPHHLKRALTTKIISWIGVGFSNIKIPE